MTGGLSRKLVLEERQGTSDGAGGVDASWVTLGVHWGEISARAGRFEPGTVSARSRVPNLIRIRAVAPDQPSRPLAGQRFRDGDRLFLIRAVSDAPGAIAYLDCLTDEEGLA